MPRSRRCRLAALIVAIARAGPRWPRNRAPTVGVAFGGGSARGIAHVGVIQWFEEHRIPIDVAAGTSMGGLIGGAFATGMDAAELRTLCLNSLNWDDDVRLARTSRSRTSAARPTRAPYPSRLEFGLKGGIVRPPSLNNGEQVDLLVGRIAAPYYGIRSVRRPADAVSRRRRGPADRDAGRPRSRVRSLRPCARRCRCR